MLETSTSDVSNSISEFELCSGCNKPNTGFIWCQQCNAKRFQQDFPNWTSGNEYISKFIQETQLNAQKCEEILEWIPYNRLTNIEYLSEGGFSIIYKAIWLDGRIKYWNNYQQQWERQVDEVQYYKLDTDHSEKKFYKLSKMKGYEVVIKRLKNSSKINDKFLNEVNKFLSCTVLL